jgi:hypothetical protein
LSDASPRCIAHFCIQNGHILLHADRDFGPMREHLGLRTL